jgi:hypothetical protein
MKQLLLVVLAVLVIGGGIGLIYSTYFAPKETILEAIYPEGFEWPAGIDLPNP